MSSASAWGSTTHSARRPSTLRVAPLVVALFLAACSASTNAASATSGPSSTSAGTGATVSTANSTGIHKVAHVIVIMQENRSFDTYFGTYPGADGIPMINGVPTVCVPDPARGRLRPAVPRHRPNSTSGGPHGQANATADIDGGQMNGFVGQAEHAKKGCAATLNPECAGTGTPDVMGYIDQREIPNYWTWAGDYVLQDHMFEPTRRGACRRTCSSSRAGRRSAATPATR